MIVNHWGTETLMRCAGGIQEWEIGGNIFLNKK